MDSNHQSSVAALQLTSPLPSPSVTRQTSTLIGDSLNDTEPGSSARSSCALTDACPQPRQDARDVKAPNSSLSSLVFDTQDASDGLTFYPLGRTPTPGNLRTIRFTSRGTRYKMQEVSDAVVSDHVPHISLSQIYLMRKLYWSASSIMSMVAKCLRGNVPHLISTAKKIGILLIDIPSVWKGRKLNPEFFKVMKKLQSNR